MKKKLTIFLSFLMALSCSACSAFATSSSETYSESTSSNSEQTSSSDSILEPIKKIELSQKEITLLENATTNVTATAYLGTEKDENAILIWESENTDVATVENGKITAVGAGYEQIFPTDYQNFLMFLRQANPNAYIICLLGTGTSSVIERGVSTAVTNMNDNKIVYNPFTFIADGSGGAGHPSLEAQKAWARALTYYIQTLNI